MTIKKKIISFTVIGLFLTASFAFSGNGTGLANPVNMNSISEVFGLKCVVQVMKSSCETAKNDMNMTT